MLTGKTIVLGVTGSIAAYKLANLASMLVKLNADVHVIMTQNATKFITPMTFETLTDNKCIVDTFDRNFSFDVKHVSLAKRGDLFMVAPCTANVIGKVAGGICDDMLTTTIMATKAPVLFAPAMNTGMWENAILQDNLQKLQRFGYHIIQPVVGRLACGDTGSGKMPSEETLLEHILLHLAKEKDLKDKRIHRWSYTGGYRPRAFHHQSLLWQDGLCHCQDGSAPWGRGHPRFRSCRHPVFRWYQEGGCKECSGYV